MQFNFEKTNQPISTESLHPADIVAETKMLLNVYNQLFADTISDIRKLKQAKVFSKSVFDNSIMANPGDDIDSKELSTKDLDKKIDLLTIQKNTILDHVEKLAEQNKQLEKQLSVDPHLN